MDIQTLWTIGSPDGRSPDLLDTYKEPGLLGNVVWEVPEDGQPTGQRWPLFHPSEADPDAGYQRYPYTIVFSLDHAPQHAYLLRIDYLAIAPRLAYLEIAVNGAAGCAYLRPKPSESGEIRLLSGLHTTIYAEGVAEIVIPASLLHEGRNELTLVSRDTSDVIHVDRIEAVRRLDRMASGAGFIYQAISFSRLDAAPEAVVALDIAPSVLYVANADGQLVERCNLYLELGASSEATSLSLVFRDADGAQETTLHLPAARFGHLHASFDLFDGTTPVEYTVQGRGGTAFRQSGTLQRRRKWKVFLTPHAHTDIGYTHRQWEVAERLCRNIDKALDMLEADQGTGDREQMTAGVSASSALSTHDFTYHLDSSWALETYLETRGEERRQQLLKHIRAGHIGIASSYVDLLTQFAALEDLIRNNEFTESFLRPEGLASDFTTVVDVASLSSSLPATLAGAGVRYLVHANNQDRGPFRLNGGLHRLSPFYWQGIDGSRVLVWLSKMYCELRKVCGSPPVLSAAERGLELWLDEYEQTYIPDAVLLYGQEADNTDLDPQPADFVRQWNSTYAYPQLIACDVSQFFRYVEEQFGDQLATVSGDGGAYWEDGAGSTIVPTMQVRQAQAALPAAERLETLAVLHNRDWAFPQRHYEDAWRSVLLFDEHTWGAFLSCREPEARLQHDQWAIKQHMADDSVAWANRLIHSAATRHSLSWNTDGREIVVYNPHSWQCSGAISVEISRRERVFDAITGAEVPTRSLRVLNTQAIVELWVDQLPGLSYRRYVLREDEQFHRDEREERKELTERQAVLENDHYRLIVDVTRGCATSWFDKALGRELVGGDEWGFGQFLHASGGEGTRLVSNQSDWPDGNPSIDGSFELVAASVERTCVGSTLRLEGSVPFGTLEVEWTLLDTVKRVDLRYTYHKQERLEKEAVYIAFPLNLDGAVVSSDSQLGWVNWDKDQLPGGCKEWLPLQTGILASTPQADVLVISPDIPLFCVGNVVQGRWPKELDLSGGRLFSYVLNNYWHTNYKASQGGAITFGYQLTSDVTIGKDQAFRDGWLARRPLYAQRMSFQDFREVQPPYTDPSGGVLACLDTEQVILSALKPAAWSGGYVLRLQDIAGTQQRATVAFPGKTITRAWVTDLLERDGRELPVGSDGTLQVDVPAWGLANVRVEFAP